mmetsp:Transcript_20573/g.44670  ORF Transcript_20573/g.44670 Transcript_20573/m.44670 type:complete len:91 (-) Transcript_20573:532-804(-)
MPAPVKGEFTTNICEIPINGDKARSPNPEEVETTSPSALSRSGRVLSNDVNATILNDQVHCGWDSALFKEAESTGVAAAPNKVDATIYGK